MKKRNHRHIQKQRSTGKRGLRYSPFIIAGVLLSTSVFAEWATVGLMTITQEMSTQIPAHSTKTVANINTTSATLKTNIDLTTDRLTEALKVAVKQRALTSNQIQDSNTRNTQTTATAIQGVLQSIKMKERFMAFSPETGQGFRSCEVLAENQNAAAANSSTERTASSMSTQTTQVGGKLVGSQTDIIKQRLEVHKKEFCTVSEAQAGQCDLSKLPGGDTNASLLFTPAAPGSKEALARHYVRENILGTPSKALTSSAARTPAGQDYLMATNQKSALLAMPAYSLAVIDAQNTQSFKDIDGKMVSANELIDKTVGRYYGGEDAKKWQTSMAIQDQRGLLKESNIISGVSAYLGLQTYKQSLREEALLSSLLLAKGRPVQQDVDKKFAHSSKAKLTQTMPRF